MRKDSTASGFAVIEAIIILVILVAVGFVGYKVLNNGKKSPSQSSSSSASSARPAASAITNKQDLQKAADQLKTVDTSTQQAENSLKKLVQ